MNTNPRQQVQNLQHTRRGRSLKHVAQVRMKRRNQRQVKIKTKIEFAARGWLAPRTKMVSVRRYENQPADIINKTSANLISARVLVSGILWVALPFAVSAFFPSTSFSQKEIGAWLMIFVLGVFVFPLLSKKRRDALREPPTKVARVIWTVLTMTGLAISLFGIFGIVKSFFEK